jgi:hypothetical protein
MKSEMGVLNVFGFLDVCNGSEFVAERQGKLAWHKVPGNMPSKIRRVLQGRWKSLFSMFPPSFQDGVFVGRFTRRWRV